MNLEVIISGDSLTARLGMWRAFLEVIFPAGSLALEHEDTFDSDIESELEDEGALFASCCGSAA